MYICIYIYEYFMSIIYVHILTVLTSLKMANSEYKCYMIVI